MSGCANFNEQQCRSANWYAIGEQDALLHGLRPQIHHIVHECRKVGVEVSEKAYMDGWSAGNRERTARIPSGN